MKTICVIFTGGTIGSSVSGKKVSLDGSCSSLLINSYLKKYNNEVCFEEIYPVNMLSENIRRENSEALCEAVASALKKDYEGIIITHGTDTLVFSANLISQMFCDTKIPIAFVSAMLPLSDRKSNGMANFSAAVDFIGEGIPGVFVVNKNAGEQVKVHLASRMIEPEQITGRFSSVCGDYFGIMKRGQFAWHAGRNNPTVEVLRELRKKAGMRTFSDSILTINARALLDFRFFDFEKNKPEAVIIRMYHSGTVCTAGDAQNTIFFAEYCARLGIPVILGPVDRTANEYSSVDAIKNKCIFAYNMSFEMIQVKVMLAIGSKADINETLNEDLFFEHC